MKTNAEPLIIREKPNVAIACDLTDAPDTPGERLAEYGRLFGHALASRKREEDAVELIFDAKPGVAEWVADLARREAACCPFLTHEVSLDSVHVTWRMSTQAGAAAQTLLNEIYDLPETFGDGFDGLLERLEARGFSVVSPVLRRSELDGRQRKAGILSG